MSDAAKKLLKDFYNFEDGLILSFCFFYPTSMPLSAKVTICGKSPVPEVSDWETIEISATNIQEIKTKVKGNQFNSLTSGVRLIKFGDYWCLDIDGNYAYDKEPATIEEVREYGECYIIAKNIELHKINTQ